MVNGCLVWSRAALSRKVFEHPKKAPFKAKDDDLENGLAAHIMRCMLSAYFMFFNGTLTFWSASLSLPLPLPLYTFGFSCDARLTLGLAFIIIRWLSYVHSLSTRSGLSLRPREPIASRSLFG